MLFLIYEELKLFMVDILIDIHVLYSLQKFDHEDCPSRSAVDPLNAPVWPFYVS